jgi:uncharacterized protein
VEPVQVGIVKELYLYPVKSMGGHAINDAYLNWHGFDGDRKYAFVQSGNTSHFPWLTAREVSALLHYMPYFVEPNNREKSAICVKTPTGEDFPLESPHLMDSLSQYYAGKFHLIHLATGVFDEFPISVLSTATLTGLSAKVGFPVEGNRFRPNIIVDPLEAIDAIEAQWVGRTLQFGTGQDAASVAVSLQDPRCMMVNIDRKTLKQTPEVLKEIAQNRANCAGVYGSILKPGAIKVGDPLFLV